MTENEIIPTPEYYGAFGDIYVGYLNMGGANTEVTFMGCYVASEAYL